MAIEANTPNDWGMRGATNTTLPQFQGVPRQLVVNIDDGYRPVIMDGTTLGGKFKCASSEELTSGLATKLGKTDKAESAKMADSAIVAQSANSVAGANVSGTVANATNAITAQNATKATQDNNGNNIIDTYATKTEVSSGLADKLGITDKAESAKIADSASSVSWNNVSGKPSFATVATSGNYNDLTNKPNLSNMGFPHILGDVVTVNLSSVRLNTATHLIYTFTTDALVSSISGEFTDNTGYAKTYKIIVNNNYIVSHYDNGGSLRDITLEFLSGFYVKNGTKIYANISRNTSWIMTKFSMSYIPVGN